MPAPDAGPARPQPEVADVIARTHVAFVGGDGRFGSANERWNARFEHHGGDVLRIAHAGAEDGLAVRTGAIAREGWSCADGDDATLEDGAIVRGVCAGVREELVPSEDGVAIQWRFDRAPAGDGDLVVRLDATGADRIERDDTGGVRADGPGGPFTFAHATWIDARGERTEIALDPLGSQGVTIRVPAEVLARSEYPVLLDPLIGPELPVDTAHLEFRGTGRNPAIAWNGSEFMVVFEDVMPSGRAQVRALRIDPTGAVLDERGIDVGFGQRPQVLWTGSQWIVAWYASIDAYHVLGLARIGADGVVIDGTPIEISARTTSTLLLATPAIAIAGSTAFVLWTERYLVRLRRLDLGTVSYTHLTLPTILLV